MNRDDEKTLKQLGWIATFASAIGLFLSFIAGSKCLDFWNFTSLAAGVFSFGPVVGVMFIFLRDKQNLKTWTDRAWFMFIPLAALPLVAITLLFLLNGIFPEFMNSTC